MLCADEGSVLRATTTDDLNAYLKGEAAQETSWLGPPQQLEEAWFLGLRRNAGVEIAALRAEFGDHAIEPSVAVARRLVEDGLLSMEGGMVCLTNRGRLISNDVFAEFLGLNSVHELEPACGSSKAI
jgi:oxygen-independent coproporphyrinogen-3 oxidase